MADKNITLGTLFTGNAASLIATINNLKAAFVNLNSTAARTTGAFTQSAGGVNTLSTAMGKVTGKTKDADKTAKSYATTLGGLGKAFKTMARYMVAGKTITLFTQALRNGVIEIANFDQSLHNLQAITGATDAQILGMKASLIELAQSTKFSTGELAKGMVLLGQSGFNAAEAIAAIDSVATLASATLSGLETTSQLLTTTIRAYGLEAIESGRVSDVMANAINKSKLTIDKLNTSFNYVGVSAAQAGLSVEQTAATMMVLANNGLRASTIGTGFRQVLMRLIAPNKKLQAAFKEQNIELSKVNPSIVGYENSLKSLSAVLWDAESDTVDMGKAFSLFGLRGAQASAVIVKSYVGGQFQTALEKVKELGTAEKMAAEQSEGLAFKFKNLKDNIGTLALAVGDAGLLGAFKGLVDTLKVGFLATTNAINSEIGSAVTSFVLLTTAVSGLMLAFKGLAATAIGTAIGGWVIAFASLAVSEGLAAVATMELSLVFNALKASMATWAPFAVIAGLAAIVVGVNHAINANKRAIEARQKELSSIQTTIGGYKLYIGALEKLEEQQKKGEDVTQKQVDVIKRLIKEYPNLVDEIDLSSASVQDLVDTLKRLKLDEQGREISNLVAQYRLQGKEVNQLVESFNIFGTSVASTADEQERHEKATKKEAAALNVLSFTLLEHGRSLGLSGDALVEYVYNTALAADGDKEFAENIKNNVIVALDKKAQRMKELETAHKSYTEIIIENTNKELENIKIISEAENKALDEYKRIVEEKNKAFSEGSIGADKYRQDMLNAERKFLSEVVADRQKHFDTIKGMEEQSAAVILTAKKELVAAEKALSKVGTQDTQMTYDHRRAIVDSALAQMEISKTQHTQRMLDIDREAAAEEVRIAEEALVRIMASRTASVEEERKAAEKLAQAHATLYEVLAKKEKDTLVERAQAHKTYTDSVIADWQRIGGEGTAKYELALAKLNAKYDEVGQTSQKYLSEQKALFDAWVSGLIETQIKLIQALKDAQAPLKEILEAEKKLIDLQEKLKKGVDATTASLGRQNSKIDTATSKWGVWAKKIGLTAEQLKNIKPVADTAGKAGVAAAKMSHQEWKEYAEQVGMTVAEVKAAIKEIQSEVDKGIAALDKMSAWREQTKRVEYRAFDRMTRSQLENTLAGLVQKVSQGTATSTEISAIANIKDILQQMTAASEGSYAAAGDVVQVTNEANASTSENTMAIRENTEAISSAEARPGYAGGGVIPGVGTSDTVPIMATPGEIIVPVSVIKSGRIAEFIASLGRNIRIPKLNIPVQKMATGGIVQKIGETVNLNFIFEKKMFPVTAEVGVAKALIAELTKKSLVVR